MMLNADADAPPREPAGQVDVRNQHDSKSWAFPHLDEFGRISRRLSRNVSSSPPCTSQKSMSNRGSVQIASLVQGTSTVYPVLGSDGVFGSLRGTQLR